MRTAWSRRRRGVALALAGCGERPQVDQLQAGQVSGQARHAGLRRRAVQRQQAAVGATRSTTRTQNQNEYARLRGLTTARPSMRERIVLSAGGAAAAFLRRVAGAHAQCGSAQSPATERGRTPTTRRSSSSGRSTQPLNNQPVWSEVRSGAPQITSRPRPRDERADPAGGPDVARAAQLRWCPSTAAGRWSCWCSSSRRSISGRGRCSCTSRRPAAGSSASRTGRWRSTGPRRYTFVDAGDHRPHHVVRQEGAAAADRLHAVLVARDPRQEPAQLRRSAVLHLHRAAVLHVRPRQRSGAGTTGSGSAISAASSRGSDVPSGKFNAGEKLWFWGGAARAAG